MVHIGYNKYFCIYSFVLLLLLSIISNSNIVYSAACTGGMGDGWCDVAYNSNCETRDECPVDCGGLSLSGFGSSINADYYDYFGASYYTCSACNTVCPSGSFCSNWGTTYAQRDCDSYSGCSSSSSDKSCCWGAAPNFCVYNGNCYQDWAYSSGDTYVWNSGTNGYMVCTLFGWLNADYGSNECAEVMGSSSYWNMGGEDAADAYYNSATSCCGDDSGEYNYIYRDCLGFGCTDDYNYNCCDSGSDCSYGDTCYPANSRIGSLDLFCSSSSWYVCDYDDDSACSSYNSGGSRCTAQFGNAWNLGGEVGGELSTTKCCGDDANEYPVYCWANSNIDWETSLCETGVEICCSADDDTKCVNPEHNTCYTNGQSSYRGSVYDRYVRCVDDGSLAQWHDLDESSTYCTDAGRSWLQGGGGTIGEYPNEYPTGRDWSCCEDDGGEAIRYQQCINSDSCTDGSTYYCCGTWQCVYGNTCYSSGTVVNDLYCNSGDYWYDCDYSSTVCQTNCGYSGRWNLGGDAIWADPNYWNSGTYCCGDDAGENYKTCSTAGSPSISWSASCISTDVACCSSSSDCVSPDGGWCGDSGSLVWISGQVDDGLAYCSSGNWYDLDASSTYCSGGGTWTADGGEDNCCGDDGTYDDYCSGGYTACLDANWYTNGDSNTYVCACGTGTWTGDGGEYQCCGDDGGSDDYCSGGYTACLDAGWYTNGDSNSYTCGCGTGTWSADGGEQNCCGDDGGATDTYCSGGYTACVTGGWYTNGDSNSNTCGCGSGTWSADGGEQNCCGDDGGATDTYCSGGYTACVTGGWYTNGDSNSNTCSCGGGTWLSSGTGTNSPCCADDGASDDFEQTSGAGRQCCLDGSVINDASMGGSGNSFICTDGQVYSCNSAGTYSFDDDYTTATCSAIETRYCNADNTWKTTRPDGCGCSAGTDCTNGYCIEGTCRSACTSAYDGNRCSNDGNAYTAAASGICARTNANAWACDKDEDALYSSDYYQDCYETVAGAPTSSIECDDDVAPGYSATGICAYSSGAIGAGTVNCDTLEVCIDGSSRYRDDCSNCGSTAQYSCDSNGGTSYSQTGICVSDSTACDDDEVCFDDTNYRSDCSACSSASTDVDYCDADVNPGFSSDGYCTTGGTCSTGTVYNNGGTLTNGCSNGGGHQCDSDAAGSENGAWSSYADGACVSGSTCDTDDVYYDDEGGIYYGSAQSTQYDWDSDTTGDSCDNDVDASGYVRAGMTTQSGGSLLANCDAFGGIVRRDNSNNNYYITECDTSGDRCDAVTTSSDDPWSQDGMCASNICDNDGMTARNGAVYYDDCTANYECDDSSTSGDFGQTGTCFGGTTNCDTAGEICDANDDGNADTNDCSGCGRTDTDDDRCDTDATSGGNFNANGVCLITNDCLASGNDAYKDTSDNLYTDCSVHMACDSSVGVGDFTQDGTCYGTGNGLCCTANAVIDSNQDGTADTCAACSASYNGDYYDNTLTNEEYATMGRCAGATYCTTDYVDADGGLDYDDAQCGCSLSAAQNARPCATDADGVWDGVCAYNGATYVCDTNTVFYDGVNSIYRTARTADTDGYACEDGAIGSNGFQQEGYGLDDGTCDTVGLTAEDCDATGAAACDRVNDPFYNTCGWRTTYADSCDNTITSGTQWTQVGICVVADDAAGSCDGSGEVAKLLGSNTYSATCVAGYECTETLTSGDYVRAGWCTMADTDKCCASLEIASGETTTGTLNWGEGDEWCGCSASDGVGGQLCDLNSANANNDDGRCVLTSCCTNAEIASGETASGSLSWTGGNENCGCASSYGDICDDTATTHTAALASEGHCAESNCCTNTQIASGETSSGVYTDNDISCACTSDYGQTCDVTATDFVNALSDSGRCDEANNCCTTSYMASGETSSGIYTDNNIDCGCSADYGQTCDVSAQTYTAALSDSGRCDDTDACCTGNDMASGELNSGAYTDSDINCGCDLADSGETCDSSSQTYTAALSDSGFCVQAACCTNSQIASGETSNGVYTDQDESCACSSDYGQTCDATSNDYANALSDSGRCDEANNCCTTSYMASGETSNGIYTDNNIDCGCGAGDYGQTCDVSAQTYTAALSDSGRCDDTLGCCVNGDMASGELSSGVYTDNDINCGCDLADSGETCDVSSQTYTAALSDSGFCVQAACCTNSEVASGEITGASADFTDQDEACACGTTNDGEMCDDTATTYSSALAAEGACIDSGGCCVTEVASGEAAETAPVLDGDEACGCAVGYNGQACDNDPWNGLEWDGVCARDNAGTWSCSEGSIYYRNSTGQYYNERETSGLTDGFKCDNDVAASGGYYVQDGYGLSDGTCDNSAHVAVQCGVDGCIASDYPTRTFAACNDATEGYSCDLTLSSLAWFTQEGTCTYTQGCDIGTEIAYDNEGAHYYDDCNNASVGKTTSDYETCDSVASSGGDYNPDGICVLDTNNCDLDEVCSAGVDGAAGNLQSDCSVCGSTQEHQCVDDAGTQWSVGAGYGVCVLESTACDEDEVCFDDTNFRDDCSQCYTTGVDWEECDSSVAGGNYVRNGICTSTVAGECDIVGEACYHNASTRYENDCVSCDNGNICDSNITDGNFTQNGRCSVVTSNCVVCGQITETGNDGCNLTDAQNAVRCDSLTCDGNNDWDGVCAANNSAHTTFYCDVNTVFYNDVDDIYETQRFNGESDGYRCENGAIGADGFNQEGYGASDGSCDTTQPIRANCLVNGCQETDFPNNVFTACDNSGDACDITPLSIVNFTQEGTCLNSGVCDVIGETVNATGTIVDDCTGNENQWCDSNSTFGGDFDTDGVCISDSSFCCSNWGRSNVNDSAFDIDICEEGESKTKDEQDICNVSNIGFYTCDFVGLSDFNWGAANTNGTNKYRCDGTNTRCVLCHWNNTKTVHPDSYSNPGLNICEFGCGADVICDDTELGNISIHDAGACCYSNCMTDYSLGDVNFSNCEFKNDTSRMKWCLDYETETCYYTTGGNEMCDPYLGWISLEEYCPAPGTINNSICYYNPTENRSDDCNAANGCNLLIAPINAGEYCDPLVGVTKVRREIFFDKYVVKNASSIFARYFGDPGINVSINATSLGAGIVNLNYNGYSYIGNISVSDLSTGYKTLFVKVVDQFGKTVIFNTSVYLDNILPNVTFVINSNQSYTMSRFVILSLNATDNYEIQSCSYSLLSNAFDYWHNCYDYYSYNLETQNGNVFVYVNVTDLAGNWIVVSDNITVVESRYNSSIFNNESFVSGLFTFNFTDATTNLYSIDGGAFISIGGNDYVAIDTTQLIDGTHTIQLRNDWFFGVSSYSPVKTFIVDNTLPFVNVISPIGYVANNSIIFEISDANLNLSKTNASFDNFVSSFNPLTSCYSSGQGYRCEYLETGLNNMTQLMNITAYDFANNIKSLLYSIKYSNDTQAPVINILYPNTMTNNNPTLLEITTNEPASCKASLFTNTYNYMDMDMYAVLSTLHRKTVQLNLTGLYSIYFACVDSSGNIGYANRNFFVDFMVTEINVISPTMYSNMENINLFVQTNENSSCKFDYADMRYDMMRFVLTQTANNYSMPVNLHNGTTFYIRCVDSYNNSNAGSTVASTILDDGMPVVSIRTLDYINTKTLAFSVFETSSGLKNVSIMINDTPSATFNIYSYCNINEQGINCSYTEPLLSQGLNKVTITAVDNANNVNLDDYFVTYDTINPTLTVNTLATTTNNQSLLLNITSDETCKWSNANKNYDDMENLFTNNLYSVTLSEGVNSFYIKCQDFAKNENSSSLFVTLDTYVAKPVIFSPFPQTVISGVVAINFTALDTPQISINGAAFVSTTASNYHLINTTRYSDGEIIVQIRNIDSAGNIAYGDIVRFRIDNTPSAVYIIEPKDGSYVAGKINIKARVTDDTYSVNYTIRNSTTILYSVLTTEHNISYDTSQRSDGYYTIIISAKNIVNNFIDSHNVTFYSDNYVSIYLNCTSLWIDGVNISVYSQSNLEKVILELDNITIAEDYSYPYDFFVDSNYFESKNHTLTAKVTGLAAVTNSTSKEITVNNKHSISILTPVNNQELKEEYNITFAGDNLVAPKLSIDGKLVSTSFNQTFGSYLINTTRYIDGIHEIQIIDGKYSSNKIIFVVRNLFSTYIIEPRDLKNDYTVFMQVKAPDYARYVEFYVNDSLIFNDSVAPHEYTYTNTSGNYLLLVKSYSSDGKYISNDTRLFEIDDYAFFTCDIPINISGTYLFEPNATEYMNYLFEISENSADWYSIEKYIDTTFMQNGLYTIRIIGTDVVGNRYNVSGNTNINNPAFGTVIIDKPYIKDGDIQKLSVQLESTSYIVSLMYPINGSFNDNATNGDDVAGDGNFAIQFAINDNQTHLVSYILNVSKATGYTRTLAAEFYVDNVLPEGSIIVNNGEEFVLVASNFTNVSIVDARISFSDNIGVDKCRLYYKTPTEFEPCLESKVIMFNDGYGHKKMTYEIRDLAGNIRQLNTSIIIVPYDKNILLNDKTEPSVLSEITSDVYYNNNKTLRFNFTAGFDLEAYILQYPLKYSVAIGDSNYPNSTYDNRISFAQANDTESLSLTVTLPSEIADGIYYANVRTKNHANLYNVTSKNIYIDVTKPFAPNVSGSVIEDTWSSNTTVVLNYATNDSTGIVYYKYLIDRFNESVPQLVSYSNTTTFYNVLDGVWYFHVFGVDRAANIGETRNFRFMVDASRPSKTYVVTKQQGPNLFINWSDSYDYDSGIIGYEINVTLLNGSNVTQYYYNYSNLTYVMFYNISNTTYYISVRAKNNAGLFSDFEINSFVIDTIPPKILVTKPTETVLENTVYPYLETDEVSSCYIMINSTYVPFISTNSTEHIHRLILPDGTYTYNLRCIDAYGNINDTAISFNVDTSIKVRGLSLISLSNNSYVTQILNFTIQIVGDLGVPVDDVDKNRISVSLGGIDQEFAFQNIGGGNYVLRFVTPRYEGVRTLKVSVDSGISDEEPITILPLTFTASFTSNTVNTTSINSNVIYSRISNYSVGVATDSKSYSQSSNITKISMNYDISSGFGYLFMSKPNSNIASKQGLLQYEKFDSLNSPSFGYPGSDELDVSVRLRYNYIFNFSKSMMQRYSNGTIYYANTNLPAKIALSSPDENAIKNYRLSIRYEGKINDTPIFSIDVIN